MRERGGGIEGGGAREGRMKLREGRVHEREGRKERGGEQRVKRS